jgi:hypothetical protein
VFIEKVLGSHPFCFLGSNFTQQHFNLIGCLKLSGFPFAMKSFKAFANEKRQQDTALNCIRSDVAEQGCQMVCFQTKNINLGKFWMTLHRMENVEIFYGNLEHFSDIRDIL